MKKIFTKLCLLAVFCFASANMFAQTYVYQDYEEHKYSAPGGNSWETSEFSGPPAQITFDAAKSGLWAVGDIEVSQLVNGQWKKMTTVMPSKDYKKYESFGPFDLDRNATKVRFYSNGSYDRFIKNILVTMATYADAPGATAWTAPTATVGSAVEEVSTTLAWCNVDPFTVSLTGEGASQFTCAISNNASLANHGVATISATYKHNVAGTHNATLNITNGTYTYSIALSGTTTKKTQTITWASECVSGKLPVGKEIVAPATINSGLALTYTSSNENVIAIINDGTGFKAVAAGEATITATQAGNNEWNEVSDSKVFTVTEKQIQYIHWADNLTRLKVGDAPVVLTATASILVNAETDEYVDAPERTALITYASADENVVAINGNELTIVGEGETTVTASLPGDDTFEATTLTMPVRVRAAATAACETYVLDAPEEVSLEYSVVWQERIYEPAALSGPGHILTFEARKSNSTAVGNIEIQQYVNGAWHTIDDANPGTDWRSYYYELDRNATKIRFYNGYGSYRRYFKNVLVTQATYLETTTPAITVEKSIIGDEITQTIAVQFSNLTAGVMIDHTNDQIMLSDSELGTDCGVYGEKLITLTARPAAVGTIEDMITIADEATGLALNIPVTIHTQRNTQTIIWNDSIDTLHATDLVTLTATAENPIYYTSSDSAIAYVGEANQLIIQAVGTVTITAHAAESETYDAAELSKEITILAAVPVITELPTVAPLAYGTPLTNDLLVGGAADVEGTFVWNVDPAQEILPGEHQLPIQFLPTNSGLYSYVDTTVAVTVLKSEQTIVWNDSFDNLTITDTLYLTATAMTEVYYEVLETELASIEGNRLTFYSAGMITLSAIAQEGDYYYGDTLTVTFVVNPSLVESIVTEVPTASAITYGQPLSEAVLEGGNSTVEGEFIWADGDLILSAGSHLMTALFVPVDQELYANVEVFVNVEVLPAEQTITWELEVPVVLLMGQSVELTATASSYLPVAYTLDKEGVVVIDNGMMTAVAVGNVTVTATQDGLDVDGFQNFIPAEPVSYLVQVIEDDIHMGLEDLNTADKARKVLRNGQLFIIRGEHIFDALGNMIK